jgi:hypothetical protein
LSGGAASAATLSNLWIDTVCVFSRRHHQIPADQGERGAVVRFHILPSSKGNQKAEKAGDEQNPRAAARRASRYPLSEMVMIAYRSGSPVALLAMCSATSSASAEASLLSLDPDSLLDGDARSVGEP